MLFIQELQLTNFLSHSKSVLKFKPDQKLLIDGKSGAGKSSIVEALIWVLYGKGRTDNRSMIKLGNETGKVTLVLEDDKTNIIYKIERSVNSSGKNTLKISEKIGEGKYTPTKVTGLKIMQEHLEKQILKSSYLLFINSIAYPQDNIENFVKQTATKRKDIILEIANVGAYDDYYEKTKNELNNQTTSSSNNETIIATLNESIKEDEEVAKTVKTLTIELNKTQEELNSNNALLTSLQSQQAVFDTQNNVLSSKKMDLIKLEASLEEEESKVSNANQQLIKLDGSEIEKLEEEVKGLDKLKTELSTLKIEEEKVSEWKTKMINLTQEKPIDTGFESIIKEINKQIIEVMGREVLICPSCNTEYPQFANERDVQVKRLEKTLEEKQKEHSEYKTKINTYEEKMLALGDCPTSQSNKIYEFEKSISDNVQKCINIETLKAQKDSLEKTLENTIIDAQERICKLLVEITECKKTIYDLEQLISSTPTVQNDIYTVKDKITAIQLIYNSLVQKHAIAENAEERVKENSLKLEKLQKDIAETLEKIEALKLLKDAFGQNGIKSIIIDYIIPRLEDKINEILSKLSDFKIHLDTQKSGVKEGSTIEGLFINIYNESNMEFSFDNYSGGERLKIIVAISEALAEIQNIGFRVLDELFVGLDSESTEKFAEVMTTLQERFRQLLCISHLRNIKDMFNEKIEIIKINGDSCIKV